MRCFKTVADIPRCMLLSTGMWWRTCVYSKYLIGKWKTRLLRLYNSLATSTPYVIVTIQ